MKKQEHHWYDNIPGMRSKDKVPVKDSGNHWYDFSGTSKTSRKEKSGGWFPQDDASKKEIRLGLKLVQANAEYKMHKVCGMKSDHRKSSCIAWVCVMQDTFFC